MDLEGNMTAREKKKKIATRLLQGEDIKDVTLDEPEYLMGYKRLK